MTTLRSLILLVAVAGLLASGCSSSNSEAPAFNAPHPANWLQGHGAEALADLVSCKTCHGNDFAGSGAAVSCFNCHLSGPPFAIHPAGWTDVVLDHQGFPNLYSWTLCSNTVCHGADLHGGSNGPTCFNASGSCHVNPSGDPPAAHALPFTDPGLHGVAGKDNLVSCQNCHGRPLNDFVGGYVADLFADATPEINANGNCSQCHPAATAHATNWTRNSNASNRTHASAGNKETTCVLCHNLTIDTTAGNTTAGPFSGAPSCFSPNFTNANSITSSCHPSGPGEFHDVGQDWLLPAGHVAAAQSNTPPCFGCHTQTAAGGGLSPACQDCHTAGDPLTVTGCSSCHNAPPDGLAPQGANQPNLAGKHAKHAGLTATTTDCSACHNGGGSGSLTHFDRADQTTPNYPAEVAFLAVYTAKTGGAAGYGGGQTCSNIACHGGQTTPDWTAGTLTVASGCTSCHRLASVSDQYNSYSSGRHATHAETGGRADVLGYTPTCSACHDAAALPASGHFTHLDTSVVEGNPVATLLAGLSYDNTTDPANPTCTTNIAGCHPGTTRIWGAAAAPHATDGTYRASTAHGPDAKLNLANCQGCHATPASGGPDPQFTVDIIQDKLTSSWPARNTAETGCWKCHNFGTAHPSASAGGTEDVRWYDAAPDNANVTHNNAGNNVAATLNATCGLCHPGLSGAVGSVGFNCTFCHVSNPAGNAVGTCTSCHQTPPAGSTAPNRVGSNGRHTRGAHQQACNVCHTNSGPDGTAAAANHFTFPVGGNPNFSRANLRPAPNTTPQSMTITPTANNVNCTGSCHGKNHGTETWY